MFNSFQTRLKKAGRLLPVALLPFAAHAQFNYAPGNATNTTTTYTDLGTTGTAITTANTDDANSAAQPIGFTFNYNGTAFTQFVLNTNGFIRLGATAPSAANLYFSAETTLGTDALSSTNAADTNLLSAFNVDLQDGTAAGGAIYRVATTGTAPNRVCTIQWTNVRDKTLTNSPQYDSFTFQAKLYETTNNVEFVYGPTTAGVTGTDAFRIASVGIKGSGTTAGQFVLVNKTSSIAAWSTAVFIGTAYSTSAFNYRRTSAADAGRTYRFVPGAAPATCADPTAATLASTNNSITINFTPGAGNTSYNVTYTAGGAVQTLSPAPTTSPITISGLQPGTAYNITLQSVCAGGGAGVVLRGAATTTGTPPAATYVTLPYTESFEGPWVNGLSTSDLPTANWRNSPSTGDNSWRREDDGFTSAGWRFVADETGATPPYRIRSSVGSHSARFHTWASAVGLQGKLDLYANLSGTGTKTLTFDFINPTGTDKLDVLLSTDGGATFSATPLLTATTNAAFTGKSVTIPSTSATTVIRFQATSDFGNDDMGIDNLRLAVVTATRNEALAATVTVSPNPAHQQFTLAIPAGSLRAASATLANALGQVVATRQLNLPAAGGTADFNVSSLAPGVYTLTLKSGDDLVVKRVVVE